MADFVFAHEAAHWGLTSSEASLGPPNLGALARAEKNRETKPLWSPRLSRPPCAPSPVSHRRQGKHRQRGRAPDAPPPAAPDYRSHHKCPTVTPVWGGKAGIALRSRTRGSFRSGSASASVVNFCVTPQVIEAAAPCCRYPISCYRNKRVGSPPGRPTRPRCSGMFGAREAPHRRFSCSRRRIGRWDTIEVRIWIRYLGFR